MTVPPKWRWAKRPKDAAAEVHAAHDVIVAARRRGVPWAFRIWAMREQRKSWRAVLADLMAKPRGRKRGARADMPRAGAQSHARGVDDVSAVTGRQDADGPAASYRGQGGDV